MKTSHAVSLMQSNYTTVQVVFNASNGIPTMKGTSKQYTYKLHKSLLPKVLSNFNCVDPFSEPTTAIVDSNGLVPVTIIEVHDSPEIDSSANYEYKWIVDVIDTSFYKSLLQAEKDMIKAVRLAEREQAQKAAMQHFYDNLSHNSGAKKLFEEAARTGGLMELNEPKAYETPRAYEAPKAPEAVAPDAVDRDYPL